MGPAGGDRRPAEFCSPFNKGRLTSGILPDNAPSMTGAEFIRAISTSSCRTRTPTTWSCRRSPPISRSWPRFATGSWPRLPAPPRRRHRSETRPGRCLSLLVRARRSASLGGKSLAAVVLSAPTAPDHAPAGELPSSPADVRLRHQRRGAEQSAQSPKVGHLGAHRGPSVSARLPCARNRPSQRSKAVDGP